MFCPNVHQNRPADKTRAHALEVRCGAGVRFYVKKVVPPP
jgi:hypothetical protein